MKITTDKKPRGRIFRPKVASPRLLSTFHSSHKQNFLTFDFFLRPNRRSKLQEADRIILLKAERI